MTLLQSLNKHWKANKEDRQYIGGVLEYANEVYKQYCKVQYLCGLTPLPKIEWMYLDVTDNKLTIKTQYNKGV